MPCYITYKTFGYVDEKDVAKIEAIAKEKGYSSYRQYNGIEFRNGNKQFGLLKMDDGRYQYRSNDQVTVDEIKSNFNKERFTTNWRTKNRGWTVRNVQIGRNN